MDISTIAKNKWVQISAASVVVVGGGLTVVYILRKLKNRKPVQDGPTQLTLSYYETNPDQLDEMLNEVVEEYGEPEPIVVVEIPDELEDEMEVEIPSRVNIFKSSVDTWDHEAELATRTPNAPYILHCDEYLEDEMGFHQETVTYYVGDDIMANQEDTPIYNFAGLMGELKFGHGSNDPNVVYIRNEHFRSEWEVLLHPGSFSYEVLGQQLETEGDTELKHSVQKFRRD